MYMYAIEVLKEFRSCPHNTIPLTPIYVHVYIRVNLRGYTCVCILYMYMYAIEILIEFGSGPMRLSHCLTYMCTMCVFMNHAWVNLCAYTCVCAYESLYIYIYRYIYTYVYIYIFIYLYIYICIYRDM